MKISSKGFFLVLLLLIIFSWFEVVSFAETENLRPQASFTASPTSGTAPLQVHFDASSSTAGSRNSIINYEWKFEILGEWVSSGSSPTIDHTYQSAGNYTVTLRVTNNSSVSDSKTSINFITVSLPCPDPSPSFTFNSSPDDPHIILFTAGEGETITHYLWTFGDLSLSIEENPSHTYATPGTYRVTLTVTNSCNKNATTEADITVTDIEPPPCPDPIASFSFISATGDPLNVQFNASASNVGDEVSINNYRWDFGDGQSETTTDNTITHSYADFGSYSVSLTVTNNCSHTALTSQPIILLCPIPTAVFITQVSSEDSLKVEFDAGASTAGQGATIRDYFWNFGDEQNLHSLQPSVYHTYQASGTYSVVLTVTNSCNQSIVSEPVPVTLLCQSSNLESILLSQGELEPQFQTEIEFYQAEVEYETETITVTPVATCSDLPIEIDGQMVQSGNASSFIVLEVGSNDIQIKLKSTDGKILRQYRISVQRLAPTNTALMFSGLIIDPNPFSPGWSPGKRDVTLFGGKLHREIPLAIRFYSAGNLVDTVPPWEINRYPGANVSAFIPDRYQWNGFHDGLLPSGLYDVKISSPVKLNRQIGKFQRDSKGVIFQPHALAVDSTGNLVIASHGFPLQVFSPSGEFIRFLGQNTIYDALAYTPQGMLIGLNQNRLFRIEPDGSGENILCDLSERGITIDWQDGLAINDNGEIFVGCQSKGSVLVLSGEGNLLREINIKGNDSSPYDRMGDIALGPDNRLYVILTEMQNGMPVGMIKIFSPEGVLTQTISNIYGGGPIPIPKMGAIGIFSDGSIIVATAQPFHPLQFPVNQASPFFYYFCKLSPQGQVLATWGRPGEFCQVGRIVIRNDVCYVSDQDGFHRVVAMDANGQVLATFSTPPDQFLNPVGMTRLNENRLVIVDNALERCVLMRNDGTVERVIPIWSFFISSEVVKGVYSGPDSTIYLPGLTEVVSMTLDGEMQEIISLEIKKDEIAEWGGLLVNSQGNLILTERYPGKIWFFDAKGHFLRTLSPSIDSEVSEKTEGHSAHWAERTGFFGPIYSAPEDGLYVQLMHQNQEGKWTPAFCELDLKTDKVRKMIPRNLENEKNLVIPRTDYSIENDCVAPFAAGRDYFYKVYFRSVVAYDREGRFQWSLGHEPGWTFSILGLLAGGDDLELLEYETDRPGRSGTVRVESWSVNQDVLLAQGQVEIDNIPPRVVLPPGDGMITGNEEEYTLRGDIEEKNFDYYQVWYQKIGDSRSWNSVPPAPPEIDFKERPREGILARWFLPLDYRDTGIAVKVVAWDKAKNSSESTAQVVFDDDGDGMSNSEEVALGTDPRQFSQIEIQTDLNTLVTPYFFANDEHELHFYVVEVSDPNKPRLLPNAQLDISFDNGVFSQTQGTVIWQSPDVDSQLVTVTCVLPRTNQNTISEGEGENLLSARFNLLVMRDEDRDWMPDLREISVENDDSITTFLNNHDSDGDGVIDGKDIAPRATYQACWQKTYYPGMLGKKIPLCFYGIGGVGSHTVRYYFVEDENRQKKTVQHELGSEGIMESEVTSRQKNQELANSMLFPGQTGELNTSFYSTSTTQNLNILTSQTGGIGNQLDTPSWNTIKDQLKSDFENLVDIDVPTLPSENQPPSHLNPSFNGQGEPSPPPFAITSFEGNTLQQSVMDEYLGMHEFTIKKDQEFIDFYYNSNTAVGVGLVNNVKPIDVSSYLETGIHRGYLVVTAPGSNDYSDRNLTIQWRVDAAMDETRLPSYSGDGYTKMAWLLEVFHPGDVILPPDNFLILTTSPLSSSPKLGPVLPWNKVLYSDQILAQSQGDHLYCASVRIPGERLTPGNSLFIKLTPFWVKKAGGKTSFLPLKLPPVISRTITLGLNKSILAIIQEPPYLSITVSGMVIETVSPVQEWIRRLTPRPDHPLNDAILDQLINAITSSGQWPPNVGSFDFNSMVNGVSYKVRCFSTIGMQNQWKRGGLDPQLKESMHQNSLDGVDVVCLSASNQHSLSLLFQNIPWDSTDQWLIEGESLSGGGGSILSTSFDIPDESSSDTTSAPGSSASSLLDQLKKIKNLISAGTKIYSSYKKVLEPNIREEEVLTSWFELGEETAPDIEQLQILTLQKSLSGKVLINQKTTEVRSSPGGELNQVKEKTEVVDEKDLSQSSLLSQIQNSSRFQTLLVGVKIGTIIISNGTQIYTCSSKDDWVGVTAYTLKGGVELSSAVLKLTGIAAQTRLGSFLPAYLVIPEKSFWVKGIPMSSIGGSLNVIGILTGTIETGYNVYLYTKTDDVLSKKEAARNVCASAIDTGILALEPLGGLVMGFWVIGSEVIQITLKFFDIEASPYIKKVVSTPGQFLTYTLVKIDPKSAPLDKAVDACTKAQKDAIEKCKKYNLDANRKYIYIFVPPK